MALPSIVPNRKCCPSSPPRGVKFSKFLYNGLQGDCAYKWFVVFLSCDSSLAGWFMLGGKGGSGRGWEKVGEGPTTSPLSSRPCPTHQGCDSGCPVAPSTLQTMQGASWDFLPSLVFWCPPPNERVFYFTLPLPCSHHTPLLFIHPYLLPLVFCPQNALRKLIPLADRVLVKKIEMQAKVSCRVWRALFLQRGFSGDPFLFLFTPTHPPTSPCYSPSPIVCWRHPSP